MRRLGVLGVLLTLGWGANVSVAQPAKKLMPTVTSASVPLYPRVIRAARIQGDVTLRLSTDGERVSAVEVESGPPMLGQAALGQAALGQAALGQAAKDNVKTWQFEPHTPTNFEVTFHYKLLLPS
jgi:outer membrane biosynthesis protein TonB